MRVIGVDPGAVTHGFAYYDSEKKRVLKRFQTTHILYIATWIQTLNAEGALDAVVIEDFVGGGPRDPNAIHTLRILGFIEGYARLLGIPVHIQAPQIRKPFLSEAASLVGGGYHFTDAMAHVLAYCHLYLEEYHADKVVVGRETTRADLWGNADGPEEDVPEVLSAEAPG